jgi:hypothetical protein
MRVVEFIDWPGDGSTLRHRLIDSEIQAMAPASHTLEPIVLIEVLSPTDGAETRAKVWAYAAIPSVREILRVRSTHIAAKRIVQKPDGGWPANPSPLGEADRLNLESIGFDCPIPADYGSTRFVPNSR